MKKNLFMLFAMFVVPFVMVSCRGEDDNGGGESGGGNDNDNYLVGYWA